MAANIGRPPLQPLDQVTVRHLDTGNTVAWCNGTFSGDPELTQASRAIYAAGDPVSLGPESYPMTGDSRGAAAAMLAACCGRGVIVTDPSVLSGNE